VATGVGGEPEESWEEIGQHIESQVRSGLGQWAGAETDDDWATVGRKLEDKIKSALREWLNE
jgi:hypothetical protein